jgi:signal transduction histidine kinase
MRKGNKKSNPAQRNTSGQINMAAEMSAIALDVAEQQRRGSGAQTTAQREADYLTTDLLGTVGHELRTPLAVIKGYTSTLLRHDQRLEYEERREFLQAISGATDRLVNIMDHFLVLSALETGLLVPHFTPVDIEQLVKEADIILENRVADGNFRQHHIILTVAERDAVPCVQADPRLLQIALENILENALKYSPHADIIQVTLQVVQTPSSSVAPAPALILSVKDTGIGIPTDHLDQIFERFHRVDTAFTREVNGLGLGLAISKRIVELHGGTIWCESRLGEGSTFFVALPLTAPSFATLEKPAHVIDLRARDRKL